MVNCHQISLQPLPVDLPVADRRRHGDPAEFFPRCDVRNMDLHLRHSNAGKGVPDGIAVVGESAGIDHDPFRFIKIRLLDPVDDSALVVALKDCDIAARLIRLFLYHIQKILIILRSVNAFFPDPKEINVRPGLRQL